MRQKFYFKTLLVTLLAMICGDMFAQSTETIDLTAKGYGNGNAVSLVIGENVKLLFSRGTGSNAPAYYDTGTAVRLYGGGTLTISSSTKTIKSITFTFHSNYAPTSSNCSVTPGTYDVSTKTWTGEATEIVMKNTATSGHFRFQKLVVTFKDSSSGQGTTDPENSFANADEYATVGVPYTIQELTTLNTTGARRYGSSDETVATVDGNGNVTLKKSGETNITVTTLADDTYIEGSASYKLHVAKGTAELSFAQETVTAYLGTNQNGPALTNPGDGTPTYTISDPEIATIQSNGYIQPKATGTATVTVTTSETDAWNEATASYTLIVEAPFSVDAIGTYELVTNASTLKNGDQILISYILSDGTEGKVLGEKTDNNFKATNLDAGLISADKSTIEITSTFLNPNNNNGPVVTAAVLEGSAGAWCFHTNNGYLCADRSENNYLRATTTIDDYAKATIDIEDKNATVTFIGKETRNIIRYNPNTSNNNPIFSCYSSGQNPIQLYRKVPSNVAPTVTFSPASGTQVDYGTQVTITARTATSITYSVNDGDPITVEGTTATVIINTHTTIKATATNEYGTSDEVTAEYTINQESSALSYNPTEYTITIGDDFTAPEVNKPEDYNGTITYSSSDTSVAEVDEQTGAVTVNGAGTVTITASGTETEHYAAATASYTLTVNKKASAVSFAESVVEITYGDNYNKQAATTEGVSGNLLYTSSDESIVKFHGNNVIDVLGPGTVTITATAPATETTEESSATYTLKVYAPADAVEGQTELLNETFDDCAGDEPKDGFGGNSSGFKNVPTSLVDDGWEFTRCQAGDGYLKLTSGSGNGIVVTPVVDLNGASEFSFEIAPWVGETAEVIISLENATFDEDGEPTSKSFSDLEQSTWKTKTFSIIGNGDVRITIEANRRVFIDNFVVGGGAQPAHEINLTFSSAGYLTWVATADIDFSQTEGVTAYQITEATPEGITAEEVDKVPAGAAVMLKGSGTVQLKRTSDVAALANNKMLACTDASVVGITGNQTTTSIYVLGNGSNGLGYYMLKNTLQAGKGYLDISGAAGAKPSFIAFEETVPTGISSVSADSADGVYYNLQGVRVLNPQKGIYIKDGKKIVIK